MLELVVVNKLLKKTKHYAKKTKLNFFRNAAQRLADKKKKLIFAQLDKLNVQPAPQGGETTTSQRIIWICWFQGIEQAPPLVRRCIESVQRNANGADVIILTDASIKNHLDLPHHITKKYEAGLISKAHYSDIVRCALLYQYGGIWMDATLFLTRLVPESLFKLPFSSLRFESVPYAPSTGEGYWTAYLLAAHKNSELAMFVRDLFYSYWLHHDALIEYFLIDYALLYATEKYPAFAEMMKEQPVIGNHRYLIRQFMNKRVTDEAYHQLRNDQTGIYKLSHKEKYRLLDDGDETLYSKILHNDFRLNG